MYSLTVRIHVTTPCSVDEMEQCTQQACPCYRQIGESSAACIVCLCGMRVACGGPGRLPLASATHFRCHHSNATHAPIANPPNSAQLGGIPYHSPKLHPGPCNTVGMQLRTDTQTLVTTIHFLWSTTHAKCNKESLAMLKKVDFIKTVRSEESLCS